MKQHSCILGFLIIVLFGGILGGLRGIAGDSGVYTNFNGGEITPDLYGRTDAVKFYSGCRTLENMFVWPHGPVEKRRGTYFVGEIQGSIVISGSGGMPAIDATYKYTWFAENGGVWGVPLTDVGVVTLDADNAVDVGGGIVGINYDNASDAGSLRFISGDVIQFAGTTNYDGPTHTLTAGTSLTQLQFTDAFAAETFAGTETAVKHLGSLTSSVGRLAQDSSGNVYYVHTKIGSSPTISYITRIAPDGTTSEDYNWLSVGSDSMWDATPSTACYGLAITGSDILYAYYFHNLPTDKNYVYKFDLSDGSMIWGDDQSVVGAGGGFEVSIDASGNAYALMGANMTQFASADGAQTGLTSMGEKKHISITGNGAVFVSVVDDTMGIVIGGGNQAVVTAFGSAVTDLLYNFCVRTFDDSQGDRLAVGGTYTSGPLTLTFLIGTTGIVTNGSHIFVLIDTLSNTTQIYKYSWNGSSLTEVANAAGPLYGVGLYFDVWGNLVVTSVDWITSTTERFYFYDTDLNSLGFVTPFTQMLRTWDAAAGGAWIASSGIANGDLGTPGTPAVPDTIVSRAAGGDDAPARLLAFERSTDESHVIEMGVGYMQFYKDVP